MYTYAFLKTPAVPLQLPQGVYSPVQLVGTDQLSALVEPELELETLQTDDHQLLQAVLSHDRVICETFLQTAVLPLRFGTRFVSSQALLSHLETYLETYLETLTQFEGKAEYTLRLTPIEISEGAIAADRKGKEYFLAKKQQHQAQLERQQQQQRELQQFFTAISQVYPVSLNQSESGEGNLHILLERDRISLLERNLQDWQKTYPHWQFTLGNPLPPYHFVGGQQPD